MAVILAHCHYSLTVGQQHTDVEYDFAALEKHLLNEFVYSKPHIQLDIPHVVFRKDVYTGEKFDMIRTKVHQVNSFFLIRKSDVFHIRNAFIIIMYNTYFICVDTFVCCC